MSLQAVDPRSSGGNELEACRSDGLPSGVAEGEFVVSLVAVVDAHLADEVSGEVDRYRDGVDIAGDAGRECQLHTAFVTLLFPHEVVALQLVGGFDHGNDAHDGIGFSTADTPDIGGFFGGQVLGDGLAVVDVCAYRLAAVRDFPTKPPVGVEKNLTCGETDFVADGQDTLLEINLQALLDP